MLISNLILAAIVRIYGSDPYALYGALHLYRILDYPLY